MNNYTGKDTKLKDLVRFQKTHICQGCKEPIKDEYILRLTETSEWHTGCLLCSSCGCHLENLRSCFMKNSKLYCKVDYRRLFSRSCQGCKIKLKESDLVIKVKSYIFHVHCFRCHVCRAVLMSGDSFCMESVNQTIFCKKHFAVALYIDNLTTMESNNPILPISNETDIFKTSTRIRTILSDKQVSILKSFYAVNPKPDVTIKEKLAELTGLPLRVIRVWFQNKRCKDKKKSITLKEEIDNSEVNH